jgi:hypothetical protein
MKRVLIGPNGSLNDVVAPGQEFPVHPSLQWIDAPDDVSSAKYFWNGSSVMPIIIPLAEKQESKKNEINARRDVELVKNITVNNHDWQADKDSQNLIMDAVQAHALGLGLPSMWRTADNINVTITDVQQLVDIVSAIKTRTESVYYHSWVKKAAIDAADADTIDSITWDSI